MSDIREVLSPLGVDSRLNLSRKFLALVDNKWTTGVIKHRPESRSYYFYTDIRPRAINLNSTLISKLYELGEEE